MPAFVLVICSGQQAMMQFWMTCSSGIGYLRRLMHAASSYCEYCLLNRQSSSLTLLALHSGLQREERLKQEDMPSAWLQVVLWPLDCLLSFSWDLRSGLHGEQRLKQEPLWCTRATKPWYPQPQAGRKSTCPAHSFQSAYPAHGPDPSGMHPGRCTEWSLAI